MISSAFFLRPDERLGVGVVVCNVRRDGLLQVFDAPEDAPTDAFPRDFTEPPLHQVEPRR